MVIYASTTAPADGTQNNSIERNEKYLKKYLTAERKFDKIIWRRWENDATK